MTARKHSYPKVRKSPTREAPPHEWSDEEMRRLVELKNYGKLSETQIAEQLSQDFGRPYSKAHVNCKLKRLPANVSKLIATQKVSTDD